MNRVFATSYAITCPAGLNAAEAFSAMSNGISALKHTSFGYLSDQTWISSFSEEQKTAISKSSDIYCPWSFFEQILMCSVAGVLNNSDVQPESNKTILVIATTKGNINQLEQLPSEKLFLHHSANNVARAFGFVNKPVVISNACISGLAAIIYAKRLLQSGRYSTAVVAGADVLGQFIISGFDSLKALSPEKCRPFDKNRMGINLGEGSAAVVLQANPHNDSPGIELLGGCLTNDANHISAPSRTGEELAFAITQSLAESKIKAGDLQFVSAHGTGTIYNDEMEAKALNLAKVEHIYTHSLKGYIGHTLGAAGLIETIICFQSLMHQTFLPSLGYSEPGTTVPVNILTSKLNFPLQKVLKTMAGFGGCNAALVFTKIK